MYTRIIFNVYKFDNVYFVGEKMAYKNYKKDEPAGLPYLHMNFDSEFAWDTKDDANDKDNGFICKRKP